MAIAFFAVYLNKYFHVIPVKRIMREEHTDKDCILYYIIVLFFFFILPEGLETGSLRFFELSISKLSLFLFV